MTLPSWWASIFSELDRFAIHLQKLKETARTGAGLRSEVATARVSANEFFTDEKVQRRFRRLRLKDIPIPFPSAKGLHPTGVKINRAAVSVLYECWDEIAGFEEFGNAQLDRIRRADVQVRVVGDVAYGDRSVTVEDHWRVDTHYFSDPSVDPHPWVHYQRGGHAQDTFSSQPGFLPGACLAESLFEADVNLSALMQSPAPRIATPPLDPICAIDFVLAQHSGAIWGRMWGNVDYAGLVKASQDRLWEPWFALLADRRQRRRLMPFYGPPKPTSAIETR